jgi:hypothetical protein
MLTSNFWCRLVTLISALLLNYYPGLVVTRELEVFFIRNIQLQHLGPPPRRRRYWKSAVVWTMEWRIFSSGYLNCTSIWSQNWKSEACRSHVQRNPSRRRAPLLAQSTSSRPVAPTAAASRRRAATGWWMGLQHAADGSTHSIALALGARSDLRWAA